jgi:hypothetical protein
METARKITVAVPPELLERAQRASGSDITQTVRTGLQLVAASQTYARLRQLRGKVRFTRTLAELKADQRFAVDTSTALQDRQVLMAPLCSRTSARKRPYVNPNCRGIRTDSACLRRSWLCEDAGRGRARPAHARLNALNQ